MPGPLYCPWSAKDHYRPPHFPVFTFTLIKRSPDKKVVSSRKLYHSESEIYAAIRLLCNDRSYDFEWYCAQYIHREWRFETEEEQERAQHYFESVPLTGYQIELEVPKGSCLCASFCANHHTNSQESARSATA